MGIALPGFADDRGVQGTPVHLAQQFRRQAGHDSQMNRPLRRLQVPQGGGHQPGHDRVHGTDGQFGDILRIRTGHQRLVFQDQFPRPRHQGHPQGIEARHLRVAVKDRLPEFRFQGFHLLPHRRRGKVHPPGGLDERPGFRDRHQCFQATY